MSGAVAPVSDVVVVPGAPLLLPEYQGRAAAAPGLLESCVEAVRAAVEHASHVVVVHATDREPRSTRPAIGLRVADHLLAATHLGFTVDHVSVAWDASVEECLELGRVTVGAVREPTPAGSRSESVFAPPGDAKTPPFAAGDDASSVAAQRDAKGSVFASAGGAKTPLGGTPHRGRPASTSERAGTTLLVVADGSARRTEKAPGHLDPRAAGVDDAIVDALRSAHMGGLDRLLDLDPALCADLLVSGRAPLQVLASAVGAGPRTDAEGARTAYRLERLDVSDPFGVLYVVAHLMAAV
ncbi:hypothetical protein N802_13015 [Knoellia sinensis KCTC 19936]|uniref:Uncharacterized protein n=1 Tax=Knoellia sinensis KCTC 19936 TaxID=1385520 RepID=A0A0A0JF87_9MICO|nr:hypothetical protein [Knoellia sinensis]KGN34276.1 hypothetical protein N802_13015 [Knoellia sinensis KCTC 19936]